MNVSNKRDVEYDDAGAMMTIVIVILQIIKRDVIINYFIINTRNIGRENV